MRHAFSRPGGTLTGAGENPALKRRAIVALSRWDEAGATPKTATGTGALPGNVPVGGRALGGRLQRPGQWQFGVDERGKGRLNVPTA